MLTLVERLRNTDQNDDFARLDAADEIERLQAAKRRALAVADDRAKEAVELRAENKRLRTVLFEVRSEVNLSKAPKLMGRIEAALGTGGHQQNAPEMKP